MSFLEELVDRDDANDPEATDYLFRIGRQRRLIRATFLEGAWRQAERIAEEIGTVKVTLLKIGT